MSRSTLHIVNNHEEMVLWVIYTDTDMKENHNYLQGLKYKIIVVYDCFDNFKLTWASLKWLFMIIRHSKTSYFNII